MARASNPLPDPASPRINTGAFVDAAFIANFSTLCSAGLSPTISWQQFCEDSSPIGRLISGDVSDREMIDPQGAIGF
jgi:hypothetical protein